MILEEIKPEVGSIKKRTRKGRGNASGFGGECGRGHKGQKSRSGYKSRPGFEGGQMPLYKRIPKKPGWFNRFSVNYQALNVDMLEKFFDDKAEVTIEALIEKGLIGKNDLVKVLGNGELKKSLTVQAHKFSKSAVEKIEKASGKCVTLTKSES